MANIKLLKQLKYTLKLVKNVSTPKFQQKNLKLRRVCDFERVLNEAVNERRILINTF